MPKPLDPDVFQEVTALRQEYLTADLVLEDALKRCAKGAVDEEELVVTLEQQRLSYEAYMAKVHEQLLRAVKQQPATR